MTPSTKHPTPGDLLAPAPATPSVAAVISEAIRLEKEIAELKPKEERLKVIKESLRAAALGATGETIFAGENPGETALVKPVNETFVRSVPGEILAKVRKCAGEHLDELFSLAPAKGFEINALKLLTKGQSAKLIALLRVPSTPRVSFSVAA